MVNSSHHLVVIVTVTIISIVMILSVAPLTVDHISSIAKEGHNIKSETVSQTYASAHADPVGNYADNSNNFVGTRAGCYVHNYSQVTSVKYSVNFTEVGLPESVTWYINLSNGEKMSSNTTYIETSLVNGSYSYFVGSGSSSYAGNGGVFSVNGASKIINITFFRVYSVTFTEIGVRLNGTSLGWAWTVNVSGGPQALTFGLDLQFHLPNGTYRYETTSTNRSYYPEQPTGIFTVNGTSIFRNIVFKLVTFKVLFTETGLPTGTLWRLSFNDTTCNVSSASVSFVMPNGTYHYCISTSSNYTSSCSTGLVTVNGSNLYKNIAFTRIVSHKGLNISMILEEIVLPVAVISSIITFLYIRRKK
ncbi:MAG: hypothetical protein ACP5OC_08055 [Thermoplasmata archaeon]